MQKLISFICVLFLSVTSFCQDTIIPTDSFTIEGKIKNPAVFSIKNIDALPSQTLGDIATINSSGETKSIRKNVRGVLLRDVLANVKMDVDKHKELLSYYFVLVATDGYKIVLSYNEIFTNKSIYVVTESNGKDAKQTNDRIEILVLIEANKGRIAMKGLYKLIAEKEI